MIDKPLNNVIIKGKIGRWNKINSGYNKTLSKEIFLMKNNDSDLIIVDKNLNILADNLVDESCIYNPLDYMYDY